MKRPVSLLINLFIHLRNTHLKNTCVNLFLKEKLSQLTLKLFCNLHNLTTNQTRKTWTHRKEIPNLYA